MKEKVLTLRQQIWAYARWCDGYTYQQMQMHLMSVLKQYRER